MKLVFILDPLDSLKSYKDTSIALMREAVMRGHTLYIAEQHDVFLRGEIACINVRSFTFTQQSLNQPEHAPDQHAHWYTLGEMLECKPADFDAILMRKDPPFDNEYLYSTYLLEIAANQGALVLNNPASIRGWNEKLAVTRFPQFTPEFLVTANQDLIREFLITHGDIVVKPLDGMGGSGGL